MGKWTTFLMTFLVGFSATQLAANTPTGSDFNFEAGYRRDNITLSSSTRGVFEDSSVGSIGVGAHAKERFKDLDIFQIGVNGRTSLGCNFYIRGRASWGWIFDGKATSNIDREFAVSDSSNSEVENVFAQEAHTRQVIDDKWVIDANAAIGYPFYFCNCTAALSPTIGYEFNEQNIHIDRRSNVRFNTSSSSAGLAQQDGCCKEKFINRWYGPFIGVDFNYAPCDCWNLYANLEYHFARFRGRTDLDSGTDSLNHFRGHNRARGWSFRAGAFYDFCDCWTAGLDVYFKDLSTSKNRHHIEGSEGEDLNEQRTRNHASWNTYAISLTLGREF